MEARPAVTSTDKPTGLGVAGSQPHIPYRGVSDAASDNDSSSSSSSSGSGRSSSTGAGGCIGCSGASGPRSPIPGCCGSMGRSGDLEESGAESARDEEAVPRAGDADTDMDRACDGGRLRPADIEREGDWEEKRAGDMDRDRDREMERPLSRWLEEDGSEGRRLGTDCCEGWRDEALPAEGARGGGGGGRESCSVTSSLTWCPWRRASVASAFARRACGCGGAGVCGGWHGPAAHVGGVPLILAQPPEGRGVGQWICVGLSRRFSKSWSTELGVNCCRMGGGGQGCIGREGTSEAALEAIRSPNTKSADIKPPV